MLCTHMFTTVGFCIYKHAASGAWPAIYGGQEAIWGRYQDELVEEEPPKGRTKIDRKGPVSFDSPSAQKRPSLSFSRQPKDFFWIIFSQKKLNLQQVPRYGWGCYIGVVYESEDQYLCEEAWSSESGSGVTNVKQ